ncbi:MAG: oxygen-independent coproporphyrinogen III oxidase [Pseudomonadota bacterium]
MTKDLIARYGRRLPRYTSYPTAPHFHDGIGGEVYGTWLDALAADEPLSLYLHVPFCDSLCWYCGCHTKVVNRYAPIAGYLADLIDEIALVADRLGTRHPVTHIHLGGGSPTVLRPDDLELLGDVLRERFEINDDAEIAIEVDPRGLRSATVAALRAIGINRVSLGLQDINPTVQMAINRFQPPATNRDAVTMVRDAGIKDLNLDLMYGLPRQTLECVLATVDHALTLKPDRIALFGYAHVPTMKRHQRLIPKAALPDAAARLQQSEAAARQLVDAGFVRIGFDHFARPEDPMAQAATGRGLQRNFQGYSTDVSETLLGFGASSIGTLRQGYVQNATDVGSWRDNVRRGALPTARGIALTQDDRRRRAIINDLMCHLSTTLVSGEFETERQMLAQCEADGLVRLNGDTVCITERGRPLVRNIASAFDAHLSQTGARHAQAI